MLDLPPLPRVSIRAPPYTELRRQLDDLPVVAALGAGEADLAGPEQAGQGGGAECGGVQSLPGQLAEGKRRGLG